MFAPDLVVQRLKSKGLTEDYIESIEFLPSRKVKYGGNVTFAKVDQDKGLIFLLDAENRLTGEMTSCSSESSKRFKASIAVGKSKGTSLPSPDTAPACEQDSEQPCDISSDVMEKKKAVILTALCSVVSAILAVVITLSLSALSSPDSSAAADQSFAVVQATRSILPGDVIAQSDLERIYVSGDVYNQAALDGGDLYRWSSAEDLVGMYASAYIASGQCLSYENITGLYEMEENPLLHPLEGYEYFDIPVNLSYKYIDSILIGRYLDLKLEVTTSKNTSERVDTNDVPGLSHSSSVTEKTITDIYKLENVVIVDMVAGDGSSLYETFYTSNQIPDGLLYDYFADEISELLDAPTDPDGNDSTEYALRKYCVATIRIQIPKEQAKAIGKLTPEDTKVTISNVTDVYVSNDEEQTEFITEMRYTTQVLAAVLKELA